MLGWATGGFFDHGHPSQHYEPLPRKVPMRVEPKSFFANERTFLSWTSMAVTMGSVSTVLSAFAGTKSSQSGSGHAPLISRRTIDVVACVYTPLALLFLGYALHSYRMRRRSLRRKEMDFIDQKLAPVALGTLVLISLSLFTLMSYFDFIARSRG